MRVRDLGAGGGNERLEGCGVGGEEHVLFGVARDQGAWRSARIRTTGLEGEEQDDHGERASAFAFKQRSGRGCAVAREPLER